MENKCRCWYVVAAEKHAQLRDFFPSEQLKKTYDLTGQKLINTVQSIMLLYAFIWLWWKGLIEVLRDVISMFGSDAETMHSSFQGLVCRATIKVDFSEMYVTKIDFL